MEKRELETKAEQYKREMMQLYEKSCPARENRDSGSDDQNAATNNSETVYDEIPEEAATADTEETVSPSDDENIEISEEELPLPYDEEEKEAEPSSDESDEEDIDLRFPEPDLSELGTELGTNNEEVGEPPSYPSEESIGNSQGFIRVNVRTGRDSGSIEGANVIVTATINGNRMILASGETDNSGTTRVFKLPAPEELYSQSPDPAVRPYSLFDVSVTADGFFNSISVDVPVFPGITSVQNFNMVPVPLLMDSSDETVVYYNQEPNFQDPVGQGG